MRGMRGPRPDVDRAQIATPRHLLSAACHWPIPPSDSLPAQPYFLSRQQPEKHGFTSAGEEDWNKSIAQDPLPPHLR